jgi:hypothetical protein
LPSWLSTGGGTSVGVVAHEEHPDALRTDQPGGELDLFEQCVGGVVEQQVRLVEEEREHGFGRVADLGQHGVQAREQPDHERREQTGAVHHVGELEQADHTAVAVAAQQVGDVERRLAEERARPRSLERDDRPQHDANGSLRDAPRTPRAPACPRPT